MLYAEAGEDLRVGGVAAGKAAADDYTANRYHGPKDEYDANWDWSGAVEDLQLYYAIGRELAAGNQWRSEEHTSELQSLMRISYAVFCLKKKKKTQIIT